MTICERTGVWAALSERSYEVGERSEVGALEGTILPLYVRTKYAYNTQAKRAFKLQKVTHRLRDHFATTVAHLSPSCVLSVAIVVYLIFDLYA